MRVLIKPCQPVLLKNQLFSPNHSLKGQAFRNEPYVCLKRVLATHGIEIATWDMFPRESADILYIQDLPPSHSQWVMDRDRSPRARRILELWETYIGRPHFFVRENHVDFDAIITYNPHLCDEKRYFRFFLPFNVGLEKRVEEISWADRKPLVMINTNRIIGILGHRQRGLSGLPFVGHFLGGWNIPFKDVMNQNHGELYSRRRRLARLAEKHFPNLLEIYGPGWSGEKMSWSHRFFPHRRYGCVVSPGPVDKRKILPQYRFTITFENAESDLGYISEKIWDPMIIGTVPIYFGEQSIAEHVWPSAFVDARQFKNDSELFEFVRDCPESHWNELRAAGRQYLASTDAEKFTPEAYARRVADIILKVASSIKPDAITVQTASPAAPAGH